MSHIVEIQTEVRDPVAIRAACDRLHLPAPEHRSYQVFAKQAIGWGVQLPEWRYPVVCDVNTGTLAYDNFEGRWAILAGWTSFSRVMQWKKPSSRHAERDIPFSNSP